MYKGAIYSIKGNNNKKKDQIDLII